VRNGIPCRKSHAVLINDGADGRGDMDTMDGTRDNTRDRTKDSTRGHKSKGNTAWRICIFQARDRFLGPQLPDIYSYDCPKVLVESLQLFLQQ
jgi:hypothetical protein